MTQKPGGSKEGGEQPHDAAFWERQEGEPATAFLAFTHYRDMGLTRSLRKAAAEFYARDDEPDGPQRDTEGTPGTAALRRFKQWSRVWLWQARVEAFDAEEARRRSLEMQQERIEMFGQHLKLVRLGLNVSAKTLYDCMRGESFFPPSQIPSLVNSITQLHRLTLGEATAIEETRAKDPDASPPEPDFSTLSDEELDTLLRLSERVWGGG